MAKLTLTDRVEIMETQIARLHTQISSADYRSLEAHRTSHQALVVALGSSEKALDTWAHAHMLEGMLRDALARLATLERQLKERDDVRT